MTVAVNDVAVARFRAAVTGTFGLRFDDDKLGFLAELLERRASGVGAELYLARLDDPERAAAEMRELARELTVGETYFFRHREQFSAFAEVVIPRRIAARAPARELRVLCAGCASGEEAYTLAMHLLERAPGCRASVRAVDVHPGALERALRARYTTWSLRETPAEARARWFTPHGRELELDPQIRALVTLEERNLTHEDPDLWCAGQYDAVFCRNVLMYFEPAVAQRVVERIGASLAPGGYLFLGHAETLRGLSGNFHLRHTHDAFYYQLKDGGGLETQSFSIPAALPFLEPSPDWSTTWLETVRRSSERIRVLADATPPGSGSSPRATSDESRRAALALLVEERFAEALDRLGDDGTSDPETLLIRAVLLAQRGDAVAAEAACERLLAIDELSAGAHYLVALCREGAGDTRGAVEHDRIAVYLDPSFAMPRLHLGLMARRAGDGDAAGRDLEQAAVLLRREDASHLLLFGGGFGRDALIALCLAELAAARGRT